MNLEAVITECRSRIDDLTHIIALLEQTADVLGGHANGLTRDRVGRFTKHGLENVRRANQELWVPCPKGCLMIDKKSREQRPKKHRLGHAHLQGAQVKKFPHKPKAA